MPPSEAPDPIPQGLGTGSLFTDNVPSPLVVEDGTLRMDTSQLQGPCSPAHVGPVVHSLMSRHLAHCRSRAASTLPGPCAVDLGFDAAVDQWNTRISYGQTSGSTGAPVAHRFTMEAVQASAASTADHFGLDQARCKEVHGLVRSARCWNWRQHDGLAVFGIGLGPHRDPAFIDPASSSCPFVFWPLSLCRRHPIASRAPDGVRSTPAVCHPVARRSAAFS